MPTRRHFMGLSAAAMASLVSPWSRAASGSNKRFIFVVNYGGWDPTRVFATEFANPNVDLERDAQLGTLGDLSFVDHADRPSVRGFFERYGQSSLIVNGILVPSVAHLNCMRLMLTGTTASTASDWPAILASASPGYALPHLVVAGPSYPGAFGANVTRTGGSGQLEGLMSGDILDESDIAVGRPSALAEDVMDRYLLRRSGARAADTDSARDAQLAVAFDSALERSTSLKDLLHVTDWSGGSSFSDQVQLAVDVLGLGISRCATVQFSHYSWDSHASNDLYQSLNFEQLFSGLVELMAALETTPSDQGGTLADDTVVVVVSEMGRTPLLNASDGKDHWPYTSALLVGPGLASGRVIGGFDESYYGLRIDPSSGAADREGSLISSDALGATLLQLADVDPAEHLPGVSPLPGLLG